jgi:quercetin dioxygenase-like cupin family protein
LLLSLLG